MIHIVLVEPEIPSNTGNIGRTCAATGVRLHLVHPLGFETGDKALKRAGLDYWHEVDVEHHDSFEKLQAKYAEHRFFFVETKTDHLYTDFEYQDGDFFVLGKESAGLPKEMLEANKDTCMRLPMTGAVRSLNLSNVAAVIVYEALRQVGFSNMD
ncbi:tRNA (uridine(34)/cytosine(34)/5-carboxymethylaminomethyluridine(34)-2'-O)-methyltransferase TrmL [Chengkuizengella axinellae]|uniref:Putative tRNA (cytidine(34)-2'-O)-methyltransferase n=1 Tax=Chengkuizengella axinellae TaxID=3064388 RepID=A0ABT9J0P9_9BACL|nr:tRNA (uridine(34)/cytosine(34)/5-carboxymethylaminomethyluridine(34)-2'-O)-methyltransferase TrmL [Chengkuizengella sp. 2205SS18-9]MDP5275168.1 tRNA (uridine(34)/cytosine(34)/5-carboxymethylaminomethyluridine(34)-2'-O)-methyltransferase TrmL [Chengkuizengella sp. 2205SS18-9]